MTNIIEKQTAPSAGRRVTFGILIHVGEKTQFNEWGLSESLAKQVDRLLTLNGDKPLPATKDGVVYSRRLPSDMAAELAELEAQLTK